MAGKALGELCPRFQFAKIAVAIMHFSISNGRPKSAKCKSIMRAASMFCLIQSSSLRQVTFPREGSFVTGQ